MSDWWSNLSEGQGTVLAAGVTVVAAGIGVVAGWLLFRGQVRDLGTALEKSKQLLDEHREVVADKLEAINEQLGAIIGRVSEVAGGVSDIQAGSGQAQDNAQQAGRRDDLKKNWIAIRDQLDSLAVNHTDGRTRAKYGRISRRNYHELIETLEGDDMLNGHAHDFFAANQLWQRFQRGRAVPSVADVRRMVELRAALVPDQEDA